MSVNTTTTSATFYSNAEIQSMVIKNFETRGFDIKVPTTKIFGINFTISKKLQGVTISQNVYIINRTRQNFKYYEQECYVLNGSVYEYILKRSDNQDFLIVIADQYNGFVKYMKFLDLIKSRNVDGRMYPKQKQSGSPNGMMDFWLFPAKEFNLMFNLPPKRETTRGIEKIRVQFSDVPIGWVPLPLYVDTESGQIYTTVSAVNGNCGYKKSNKESSIVYAKVAELKLAVPVPLNLRQLEAITLAGVEELLDALITIKADEKNKIPIKWLQILRFNEWFRANKSRIEAAAEQVMNPAGVVKNTEASNANLADSVLTTGMSDLALGVDFGVDADGKKAALFVKAELARRAYEWLFDKYCNDLYPSASAESKILHELTDKAMTEYLKAYEDFHAEYTKEARHGFRIDEEQSLWGNV